MKHVALIFIVLLLNIQPTVAATNYTALEPEEEITFTVEKLKEFTDNNLLNYTLNELDELIETCRATQEDAHALADSARALGWPEDSEAIQMAKNEYYNAGLAIKVYTERKADLEFELEWKERKEEYPVATEIWLYMKSLGWNNYVCAGILGNMMTEVGGNTLDIRYWLKGNYYGICQWSRGYSKVWGANLKGQLDFLKNTIKYELNTYGYAYANGFNYEKFLALQDERAAALSFARCYERCGSAGYAQRQKNATVAYNYFVS